MTNLADSSDEFSDLPAAQALLVGIAAAMALVGLAELLMRAVLSLISPVAGAAFVWTPNVPGQG